MDAHGRAPLTSDEELLEAETRAIDVIYDDAARVDRMAGELRSGFEALAGMAPAVSVFGSARTPSSHPQYEVAREMGRRLAEDGYGVITGGGPGVMEAANRGAREGGGSSVGLGIDLPHEQGMNEWVDLGLQFHYFFTRKVMFVRYACAFVVFPGGFGTLDEVFEAATLRQTGKVRWFPIVLFGAAYWRGLVDWLRDPVEREGKISAEDVEHLEVTDDVEHVLELLGEVQSYRR
ncbi:MAG: TIGR00730 family Rossman fold protein [Thermoleophilaceae bacterium]